MNTLLVTTDSLSNARQLASFLKNVKTVKSVTIDPPDKELYDWTNPSRPATDEEFEKMILEAEKEIEMGLGIPAEAARKQTISRIKAWKQKRK